MTICKNSLFKHEYEQLLIEGGKRGDSIAEFCSDIEITKPTFYDWVDRYPSFKLALERHNAHSEAFWTRLGRDNLGSPDFNANMYHLQMGSRFGISKSRKVKTNLIDIKNVMKSFNRILKEYDACGISLTEFSSLTKTLLDLASIKEHEEISERLKLVEALMKDQKKNE